MSILQKRRGVRLPVAVQNALALTAAFKPVTGLGGGRPDGHRGSGMASSLVLKTKAGCAPHSKTLARAPNALGHAIAAWRAAGTTALDRTPAIPPLAARR